MKIYVVIHCCVLLCFRGRLYARVPFRFEFKIQVDRREC